MQTNPQEYIEALINLEPVFKKAGQMALEMQATAASRNKFNTGFAGVDIVTEADLALQEFILSEISKTKLSECILIGEEDTPSVTKFKGTNDLVLTLDPIDGTILYASGKRFFLTIVSLRQGEEILYTFLNYPVFGWSRRITSDKIEDFGNLPEINLKTDLNLKKVIAYTSKPPKVIDKEIYEKLIGQGYQFCKVTDITDESGATTLFGLGQVAGYYMETPNPYDGLVALHYGQAKKLEIYSDLNILTTNPSDHGPHYSGWYVVLNK